MKAIKKPFKMFIFVLSLLLCADFVLADIDINNWADLNANYANSGDLIFNITGDFIFTGNLQTPLWTTLIIRGWGGHRILDGASHEGFNLSNKSIDFADITFKNFIGEFNGAAINANSAKVSLIGIMNFENNLTDYNGGAIYAENSSTISFIGTQASFKNNSVGYDGGAIHARNSSIISFMEAIVSFENNYTQQYGYGGAIYARNSSTISFMGAQASFENNSAHGQGGVTYANSSIISFTMSSVRFSGNSSAWGGIIYAENNSIISFMESSAVFINNSANSYGGAIYALSSTIKLTSSIISFANNSSDSGGIYIKDSSNIDFAGSIVDFIDNSANRYGGALFADNNSRISFKDSNINFINNKAGHYADAIMIDHGGSVDFIDSKIIFEENYNNNASGDDSMIYLDNNGRLSFTGGEVIFASHTHTSGRVNFIAIADAGSELVFNPDTVVFYYNKNNGGNGAFSYFFADFSFMILNHIVEIPIKALGNESNNGGFLYLDGTSQYITFKDSIFENNKASADGGVFYINNSTLTIKDSTFKNNKASADGGVFYMNASSLTIQANNNDVIFQDNQSSRDGGVFHIIASTLTIQANNKDILFQDNQSLRDGGVFYMNASSLTIEANNKDITFKDNQAAGNGGVFYISASTLTIKADNNDVIFKGNQWGGGSPNDIYMAQNSHLQFNIAEGKKIIMDGGIKSDIGNTIKKTGTGDLILDGITDFKGELNLESGQIISLAPVINISSFIMSSQAKFSLKNAAVSGLNIDSGVINGIIELDLDFNASTGDFIYASNSLEIISSSSITISLLALGKQGNEIEIIRAGNLIYTDGSFFGYDPSIYNIYKEGNSIIAKLIRNPNPISYLGNLNSNQNSVFNLLNASINIPLSDLRYQVATLENGKAKKALSKLSGSFLINAAITGGKTENIDSVFNRISYNAPAVLSDEENSDEENSDKNIPVWLQLNFNNENFESVDSPLGKIDYSRAGFLAGAELLKNAGLFIGYASKTIKQDSDKADISDIELGVYNSMQLREQINVKLALSASLQNIASDRSIDFANLNPQADFDSKSIKFGASAQWTISDLLKPFISVQGALVMLNDIEEKNGGAANLIIKSDNYTRLSTLSGLKIEKQGDINIYAKSYLSYLMLGADPQYEISFTIEEAPQSMKIKAEKEPQLLFGLGAGINYKASETINAFADIAIELAPDLTGYKANIGAKVKF